MCIEASYWMFLKCSVFAHVLCEPDHCLIADGIELTLGCIIDLLHEPGHFLVVCLQWIRGDVLPYLIPEVGDESQIVLKFDE